MPDDARAFPSALRSERATRNERRSELRSDRHRVDVGGACQVAFATTGRAGMYPARRGGMWRNRGEHAVRKRGRRLGGFLEAGSELEGKYTCAGTVVVDA